MAGHSNALTVESAAKSHTLARRLLRWFVVAALVLAIILILCIVNNNFSFSHQSRAQFVAELDREIESSTQWLSEHPGIMHNAPLMYMVGEMSRMSGDPRMRGLAETYLHSRIVRQEGAPITWYYARLVDGTIEVPRLTIADMGGLNWQDEVDAYAVAPQRVDLPASIRNDLFSPTKFHWGWLYHQLIALDIYRQFNGSSPELDAVINPVAERVANEQRFDFRVTDSYPQRLWILFGAGRPDLVNKRWVERLMSYQRADGSWNYCWYGWCKGALEFSDHDLDPVHTTVQAAYALYLIKYRYPEWINQHFE